MGVALSCLLTVAALTLFALAMDKHHRQATGRAPTLRVKRLLQIAAAALTVLAPIPWIAQEGPTMALVTWVFCGTPLAGLVVVGLFSWAGERARR